MKQLQPYIRYKCKMCGRTFEKPHASSFNPDRISLQIEIAMINAYVDNLKEFHTCDAHGRVQIGIAQPLGYYFKETTDPA